MSGMIINKNGLYIFLVALLSLVLAMVTLGYSQSQLDDTTVKKNSDTKATAIDQETKYSFEFTQGTLKEALESLASKADLTLSYNSKLLEGSTILNVAGNDLGINKALDKVLENTVFDYEITNSNYLVIFKKAKMGGSIKGRLVDSTTGEPSMQGGRVYLLKAETSMFPEAKLNFGYRTLIGAKGRYEIDNIKPGAYRLFVIHNGLKELYKKVTIREGQTIIDYCRLKFPRL